MDQLLEVQLAQLAFHKEQVCACGQLEVWLRQQQQQSQLAALQRLQFLTN